MNRWQWTPSRGWTRLALLAVSVFVAVSSEANAGEVAVLWNKLGSDAEVLDSAHGPDLEFYTGGGGSDWPANHWYVPGVFGNAVTIDCGTYYNTGRYHNIVFDNLPNYISPERGTVEVWYMQIFDPVAYDHNPYRVFDGSFGLGSGVVFESQGDDPFGGRLRFGLQFGAPQVAEVYALGDGLRGYNISAHNGSWIHIAGTWDRSGIDGSADKLRLYVDGTLVATSTDGGWGATVGQAADICGGNDQNIARQFFMDNLKVWDHDVTDFSHRFEEDWIPEPATALLLGLGALLIRRR